MSIWQVARRPRWIGALVFALVLAAGFALLGQWQLGRSISTGTVVKHETEKIVPLVNVAQPQAGVLDKATGQMVTTPGHWVAGDWTLLSDRLNNGTAGWWVVGHFVGDRDGASVDAKPSGLAVAVGWSKDRAGAASALNRLDAADLSGSTTVTGRYYPSEGPEDGKFEQGKLTTLAVGEMINIWKDADPGGVYGGYLVSSTAVDGLTVIDSPKPSTAVELNLLNIFYAIEWVVFAGFAIFLWYRLVRDAWERELEELAEQLAEVH